MTLFSILRSFSIVFLYLVLLRNIHAHGELKNIKKSFNKNIVLDDISVVLKNKNIVNFIGPNGVGKTTLIYIISGIIKADSGYIFFDEGFTQKDVTLILSGERNLYMKNTLLENIIYFSILKGRGKKEIIRSIDKYKELFPIFPSIKNELIEKLSYGQKRIAALLTAIISESACIIMDELSEGLDYKHSLILQRILKEVSNERLVIFISHDFEFISEFSDINYFIKNGRIVKNLYNSDKETILKNYIQLYGKAGE